MCWAVKRNDLGQFVRFVLVGCANTIIGLPVIFAAKGLAGSGDVLANVAGYVVGLSASFLLNKAWTFGYSGPVLAALAKFLLVFVFAYGLNLATVLLLIECLEINSYLAQALGIPPYAFTFFLLSKAIVFRLPRR